MAMVEKKRNEQNINMTNRFEQTRPRNTVGRISPEDIRKKAYELFQRRGGNNGSDWSDWFEAEKQLLMGRK
ncbi:MAG: DUF2934 domain-containing protein [Candidatus Omnitrophota bacterium]|jgi:hypothetical protein